MVCQTDIAKAEKDAYLSSLKFEDVTARLWQSHSSHLDRIENLRKEVEEKRFQKGDGNILDAECKFKPEVYSRREGEDYRDHDQLVADLY